LILSVWWDRMPVRKMLMLVDREEISRGLTESLEYKEIGLRIGRDAW
jgi:transposase, IS30 family